LRIFINDSFRKSKYRTLSSAAARDLNQILEQAGKRIFSEKEFIVNRNFLS